MVYTKNVENIVDRSENKYQGSKNVKVLCRKKDMVHLLVTEEMVEKGERGRQRETFTNGWTNRVS